MAHYDHQVAAHKRIGKRQFGGGGFDYTSFFGIGGPGGDEEETTTRIPIGPTRTPVDPEPVTTPLPTRTPTKEPEPEVTRTPETTRTTKTPETTRTPTTPVTTPSPTTTSTTPVTTSTTPTTTSTTPTPTTTSTSTTRSSSSSSSSSSFASSSSSSHSSFVPSSSSSAAEPSALAEGNNGQQTGGVSSGGIAGIVIGVLLGVAALGILIAFFVRRNRKKQEELNHFNASSFRRSAFLIDEGNDDYNPYGAAVAATQASHQAGLGRSPTTMTERQYGTMASVPTPGYSNTPYTPSSGYPMMQQPMNTFSPEMTNYAYMDPAQQFATSQYPGVGAGAGNGAGVGAGNGAGIGAGMGMGMGAAVGIGGYYPSQGGPKPLPDMPMSPGTQNSSAEGPFADSYHVLAAPMPVATAGGAVDLERASSMGSSQEHYYSAPMSVANPDNGSPVRKPSLKRVPVPAEREEDTTAAELSAFPSPPVQAQAQPAAVPLPMSPPPVNMSAPAPYAPVMYAPTPYTPAAPYAPAPYVPAAHVEPQAAPAPTMRVPAILTPGGSPSPKRETVYDPEDAYGGM